MICDDWWYLIMEPTAPAFVASKLGVVHPASFLFTHPLSPFPFHHHNLTVGLTFSPEKKNSIL